MNHADDSPLRRFRLSLPVPMTLTEVATWVRARGFRCTASHLSLVERGLKPPGPKLRAALAMCYGKTWRQMERAILLTRRPPRRKSA